MTDKLSVRFEHNGEQAVVLQEMTRIDMTPWLRDLLGVVAMVDDLPFDASINRTLEVLEETETSFEDNDADVILPFNFWSLLEAGDATATQLACVAFDYAFQSTLDTPWADVDADKLPQTSEEARAQLQEWLGDPEPEDKTFWEALELGLAGEWIKMGKVVRQLMADLKAKGV